jgi:dipeptidyl aminopeptidase/acylaminoacyl peptidase
VNRTPLVPSDLLRLTLPSDPRPAADGRVFYVATTMDEAADATRSSLWCVRPGSAPARFTSGTRDRMPRVSPDGAFLAFVGDRGEGTRVYVCPTDGGEAASVTEAYDAIAGLAWSPDSASLAFTAVTPLDPATARIALDARSGARHIRALPFKSDDEGLLDGRRKHLFVVSRAGGEPRRLTFGDFDVAAPAWSPDGTRIAFAAQIGALETAFSSDIFTVGVGGGELLKLTHSRGPAGTPAYSHDGAEIAYVGHERGDDAGGRFNPELLVIGVDGGEPRSLSAACDRPVIDFIGSDLRGLGGQQAPYWSADDRELFVPLGDAGTCAIAAFARAGGAPRIVAAGERDIAAFAYRDGGFGLVFSTPLIPAEVAFIDASGTEGVLTECNPWLAERSIRAPRRVRPVASDGQVLDLWLLDPDQATDAPYVLQVHGGPHTAYGYAFTFEFQIIAGHGIGVAFGNPRGSQTYGHAYSDAITGDWGGLDASDVLTLLDAAQANASIDSARIGLGGGSYGGFMTTWLLGHTKRFAAGVSMRAVNDFVSEVGAADLGWFLEREIDAPWGADGRDLFEKSPMRAASNIDVPLLVEHSERDYRCPVDQGEQLFTLLRRLGRTQTEFVRFTGDGHNLSRTGKPRNRILRLRAIVQWFVRHLRPAGFEPAPDVAGSLFAPLPGETLPGESLADGVVGPAVSKA